MSNLIRGYVIELRDGRELRFDDGMEAYRHVQTLEPGSWSRLYVDVDREAEKAHYAEQARNVMKTRDGTVKEVAH
jgi:hypothetical protein